MWPTNKAPALSHSREHYVADNLNVRQESWPHGRNAVVHPESCRARCSVFVSGIVRQFLSVSPPPLAMSVTPDPRTRKPQWIMFVRSGRQNVVSTA